MQVSTQAIVISALKYGDTSLIVKCLTKDVGIKSYLLKGVLRPGKKAIKAAHFQLLTQLAIVANHKNKGTLESLKEVKVLHPYYSIHSDVVKTTIVLFLSEILSNSLKEEEPNDGLYDFLEASLLWLDTHDKIANFPVAFLLHLTKYFGFYPNTTSMNSDYFDLVEGEFINTPSNNPYLQGKNLSALKSFLGINFDAIHTIKLTNEQRVELLQWLIVYFELHLHGFKKPRSLEVLHQIFN